MCGGKYTYSPLENSIFENNISHMFSVVKLLKIVSEFACLLSIVPVDNMEALYYGI